MVDMGVGQQDLLQGEPFPFNSLHDLAQIATGIDYRCLAGFLAPDQRAVLFKRSNGNNQIFHYVYPDPKNRNCHFAGQVPWKPAWMNRPSITRSEEHTSELQSRPHLVCRLLLEKKKQKKTK